MQLNLLVFDLIFLLQIKSVFQKCSKTITIDFEIMGDNYIWVLTTLVGVPTNLVSATSLIARAIKGEI